MRVIKKVKNRYDEQRKEHYYRYVKRKEQIIGEIPALAELLGQINRAWIERIKGNTTESETDSTVKELNRKIRDLLIKQGYKPNALEFVPLCPICEDKGFVNAKMCTCLMQMHIEECYSQSNIKAHLLKENFDTYDESLFSEIIDSEGKNPKTYNLSARDKCLAFAENFDEANYNLLLSGSVGTGKTFLSHCIAKHLIDRGKTVVYYTAYELVERMTDVSLGRMENFAELLWDCDLIILDDLGCERQTDYAQNLLFHLLNERLIRNKRIVISTNLSGKELKETYNERIFSRILGGFTGIRFYGDDLRLKKKN